MAKNCINYYYNSRHIYEAFRITDKALWIKYTSPLNILHMISTTDYSLLPNRQMLQQICKAISVADAILSPEWQHRYYSYNSKWSEGEEFCEMRNGSGDQILILFQKDGCTINGMSHEYYPKDKSKLTEGLPDRYNSFIFDLRKKCFKIF